MTVWRYDVSIASEHKALQEQTGALVAARVDAALPTETNYVALYAINKDAPSLTALKVVKGELATDLSRLRAHLVEEGEAEEIESIDAIMAGQARLDRTFREEVVPAAGGPDATALTLKFDAQAKRLGKKVDAVVAAANADVQAATAQASDDADSAKLVAIVAGLLATLLAIATAFYAVRLIGGLFGRIERQFAQIGKQLTLLTTIRQTADSLTDAASQMLAATAEVSTATNEQSAAVAEVAATTEELQVTATSIADNAKAGSSAVDQTGDTMREMQEQVEAYFILFSAREGRRNVMHGMEAGADDYLAKPLDQDELEACLVNAARVTGLYRKLAEQQAELERLNRELFQQSRQDALTQIGNRLRMEEDLATAESNVDRYDQGYAVALCDIDHFKAFNDLRGHQAGDEALRMVAGALQRTCRQGDAVYRYGGEELLVLLPRQKPALAAAAAERMRAAVEGLQIPHPSGGVSPTLTISIGIAMRDAEIEGSAERVLEEADAALYRAKDAGRNRVVVVEPR